MAKKRAAKGIVKASKPAKRKSATDDRTERALEAALCRHRGQKLTTAQSRDLAWFEAQERERVSAEIFAAVPKGVFCKMAGRQQKVIDEQADRYDLPIDGPSIDLFAAIKAYHDLISENARSLMPADDAAAFAGGDCSELDVASLKVAKLQAEIVKLQRGNESLAIRVTKERGDSIDRQELRELLGWLSTRLEGFGQQLRRSTGGEEAQTALNEFLIHLAAECKDGLLRV